jgi:hypothetical protein
MKTIFTANKSSYGTEFFREFDTLEELKKGIVAHELYFIMFNFDNSETEYNDTLYTEELFKKHSDSYTLYKIDLHEDEKILWSGYDGQSSFCIVKKDPQILSTIEIIY